MSAQQEIRTALWILAKIEPKGPVDRDRLELATGHVRAALWKLDRTDGTRASGGIGPCTRCGSWIDPEKGYIVSGPPSGVRCSDEETCRHRQGQRQIQLPTPPKDPREYIDTGQADLRDCPGFIPHCESEQCPRCRCCGWTLIRHPDGGRARAAEPTDGAGRG